MEEKSEKKMTNEEAWDVYLEAIVPAWEAYEKATAPADEAYEKATAPAWEAYQKAIAPALKAYLKAVEDCEGEQWRNAQESLERDEKDAILWMKDGASEG